MAAVAGVAVDGQIEQGHVVPTCANVALYVVTGAGAVMLCVAAPPSDQLENMYDVPDSVCGVDAASAFCELTITVFVNGVAADAPSTVSVSPLGCEVNDRLTVFGCNVTLVVLCAPALSVAVSCSCRDDG